MTPQAITKRLLALRSNIDPKVALMTMDPETGSNQWLSLQFNNHCFEQLPMIVDTEHRTRAILHLMGKAAALLNKHDPTGTTFTMRTFYRNDDSRLVPRLYIALRAMVKTKTLLKPAVDYTGPDMGN